MKKVRLWQWVLLGMFLGILFGALFKEEAALLKPIAVLFTNLIKMVVIPLIFFAVLYGITSIDDADTFGRLGLKALSIYSITTIFAVTIGLIFANIFKPGAGVVLSLQPEEAQCSASVAHPFYDMVVNIIPQNPIQAMASGNTLQVVVFAFFTGFALILIGERGRVLKDGIVASAHLMFKMVELVMKLTPYGVFAMMAWVISEHGFGIMGGLGKFAIVVLCGFTLQYVVFGLMLLVMAKLNPIPFYKKMYTIQALAFATASSKATLSTAMMDLRKKFGVSKQSANFVLPLGASMNMDATAIYLGTAVVFFSQIACIKLTLAQYFIIIITSTIGSIGAAGFPGGGPLMLGMVLSSIGLPLDGVSLLLGIDRFLDMFRTMINITGDCTVTVIVDELENKLNKTIYYDETVNKVDL